MKIHKYNNFLIFIQMRKKLNFKKIINNKRKISLQLKFKFLNFKIKMKKVFKIQTLNKIRMTLLLMKDFYLNSKMIKFLITYNSFHAEK